MRARVVTTSLTQHLYIQKRFIRNVLGENNMRSKCPTFVVDNGLLMRCECGYLVLSNLFIIFSE